MKTLLVFLFSLSCVVHSFAQCTVNLGEDIHVCQQLQAQAFPDVNLADSITITSATAPYQYEWSIEPIEGILGDLLFASTFLDDTTSSNPSVLSLWEDSLTFFLKLKDVNEQVCYDTIIVSASLFGTHLGYATFNINAGDSVQLWGPNVGSNYPIDSVLWEPTTGLNDPNSMTPWASPESSEEYSSIVWDSQGCMQQGSPFLYVNVMPVGILENQHPVIPITASENHISVQLEESAIFQLWDLSGRIILQEEVSAGMNRLPISTIYRGMLVYRISTISGQQNSGKLFVQ